MAGPGQIATRQDFAEQLTLLREQAGLTVREVASRAGDQFSHSTIGGWFAGRGLPSTSSMDLLTRVLGVCGVDDPSLVDQWIQAWWRVRRAPGRQSAGVEPYRGLAGFGPEHAEWFFGREALTARLVDRVDSLRAAGGGIELVVGASGSGKSSLLGAGLIPAVEGVLSTPSDPVVDAPVLVVDQFEEVFAVPDSQQRELVATLAAAADRGAVVVLGLRADFYAHALRHPRLVEAGTFTVGPMTPAELREAILGPARKAGIDVEDGLAELLLRDVEPGGLPLLSHALYQMWSSGDRRRLTVADYRRVGGVEGAVAATAEQAYADLGTDVARRLFLSLVHVAADAADTRRRVTAPALLAELPGVSAAALAGVLDRFVAQRLITVDADTVRISHEALLHAWPRLRGWLDADRGRLLAGRQMAGDAETWLRHGRDPGALYRGLRLAAAQEWAVDHPAGLTASAREFLDAAVRHDQRRVRRLRQLIALLVTLVVLAGTATALAVRAQREATRQRDAALSGRVAGEAAALRPVNPALAAQLSLAAYRLDPGPAARSSLLSSLAQPGASILPAADSVYAVVFSPDGRTVATASRDRTIAVWNTADPYRPARTATLETGHDGALVALAVSPDGRTLATGSWDGTTQLWDLPGRRRLGTMTGHTDHVVAVAFSPDGRLLATASWDHTVRLWDVAGRRQVGTLTGHADHVVAIAFAPDGRTLATAGDDGTARLWGVADFRPLAAFPGGATVAFDPPGRTLVTGDAPTLWDVTDPRHPAKLATLSGHTDVVRAATFSPDGRTLATGSDDQTTRLWDVTDRHRPVAAVTLGGHLNSVLAVRFSPDGRTLATGSDDRTARLWHVSSLGQTAFGATVTSVAVSGDVMAAGLADGTTHVWSHGSAATLGSPGEPVFAVAVSRDGRLLATGGDDRTVRLWSLADPRRPVELATLTRHEQTVAAVAFSADGRTLATGSHDHSARLWDINDPLHPALAATLDAGGQIVDAVAFSPTGPVLAVGGWDRTIRLWSVADPQHPRLTATLTGHGNVVRAVAFSPDGHTLASGGDDRTVRLWDVTHPGPLAAVGGHTHLIRAVTFSPDGRTVATASDDDTVRLWDVTRHRAPAELATLTGHRDDVQAVTFTPDGHTLVTAGTDHTLRRWETDPERTGQRICAETYPPITPAEWAEHFPGLRFTAPC